MARPRLHSNNLFGTDPSRSLSHQLTTFTLWYFVLLFTRSSTRGYSTHRSPLVSLYLARGTDYLHQLAYIAYLLDLSPLPQFYPSDTPQQIHVPCVIIESIRVPHRESSEHGSSAIDASNAPPSSPSVHFPGSTHVSIPAHQPVVPSGKAESQTVVARKDVIAARARAATLIEAQPPTSYQRNSSGTEHRHYLEVRSLQQNRTEPQVRFAIRSYGGIFTNLCEPPKEIAVLRGREDACSARLFLRTPFIQIFDVENFGGEPNRRFGAGLEECSNRTQGAVQGSKILGKNRTAPNPGNTSLTQGFPQAFHKSVAVPRSGTPPALAHSEDREYFPNSGPSTQFYKGNWKQQQCTLKVERGVPDLGTATDSTQPRDMDCPNHSGTIQTIYESAYCGKPSNG
ncbi:hypothetical protein DFH09DRAFT_1098975 [Mycena vulgaris]|nr:hypothetical protein DFH09DRAFT_1098975 [Mycena vulgaris]